MLGTVVKLPDGRVGTIVYNSLEGYGIKWGIHRPQDHPEDFEGTCGNVVSCDPLPADWPWYPDALLRNQIAGKPEFWIERGWDAVGDDYEVIDTTRCDICQRVLPADDVSRIGDTAVCTSCREEYTP